TNPVTVTTNRVQPSASPSPSPTPTPTPTPTASPQATSTQGNWVGTVTDSILVNDTGLKLNLSQSGTAITGTYTLGQPSNQAGAVGTFAGKITAASPSPSPSATTGTAAGSFSAKQTTTGTTNFSFTMTAGSQCTGNFTGN